MKNISYILNVLNAEDFILAQLNSIYQFAYEIIIVEGGYYNFKSQTKNFISIDNTTSLIENFFDSEKKIKHIKSKRYYENRTDMCNELLLHVTGDYIWQVDVDEFYKIETHKQIINFINQRDDINSISFDFINFYKSLDLQISGYNAIGLSNVRRIHKFEKGLTWLSQNPPRLSKTFKNFEDINASSEFKDCYFFHLTAMFEEQVKKKFEFYSNRSPNYFINSKIWLKDNFINNKNFLNIAGFKNHITYLKIFNHSNTPEYLHDLMLSSNNFYKLKNNAKKLKKFIQSNEYAPYLMLINTYENGIKNFSYKLFFKLCFYDSKVILFFLRCYFLKYLRPIKNILTAAK